MNHRQVKCLLSDWITEVEHTATVAEQHNNKQRKEARAGGPLPSNRWLVLRDRVNFLKKVQTLIDRGVLDPALFDQGS